MSKQYNKEIKKQILPVKLKKQNSRENVGVGAAGVPVRERTYRDVNKNINKNNKKPLTKEKV